MSAAPLLPPGLEAKTAEVQDTMMPEVNAHDSMLQAMRDAVLLEVERSVQERTEQLWAKGKQAFQQAQQKHREEVQRLTEEVAQCQERHKVLAEENDRLREALQSILTKCSSLAPGLAESLLSPASTFDTCSHPSRPYSPYTPGMDFYSNEVLLPEVPPLPFGKPGVACGSPAPLSLAEALGPRVNPLRLSLAESLGDTAHVEKSGEKTWEITISKTTEDEELGLDVSHEEDGKVLRVDGLRNGVLEVWNAKCLAAGELEHVVKTGDQITSCNGITGAQGILQECVSNRTLQLSLFREAAASSPFSHLRAEASEFVPGSRRDG
ncbi:unnamed protein product [Durusdinium trenchii]|uniref:PDZ domain-containing protein n=1 Tax=Durusdinium trenchii TaxID=1381693 RepID=A0ABP0I2F6_9DINO